MFNEESFTVFEVAGLTERMAEIRSQIQPVFQILDEYFKINLEPELGEELFIHIAQHRRRSVYPPENTWSALSRKKRGYKMEPHFQLGIWPEYVFMYLSLIDQPKNEQAMAEKMLAEPAIFSDLAADYVVSKDHTQPQVSAATPETLKKTLLRLRDVKKGEFQIGRIIPRDSSLWQEPATAKKYMLETYQQLIPAYQLIIPLAED